MATFDPTPNNASLPKLGSLAQAARSNQLKNARTILIVIGVLMLGGYVAIFFGAQALVDGQVEKEVKELTQKGMAFDPGKLQELKESAVRATQLMAVGFMIMGALFIVFGLMIYRFPVPITVSALVLYLAFVAINGALDPTTLYQGLIIKIIVIVALGKAIKSAIAYQREHAALAPELAG
jgi:hypothetical protein